jgi:hypothetical protein
MDLNGSVNKPAFMLSSMGARGYYYPGEKMLLIQAANERQ